VGRPEPPAHLGAVGQQVWDDLWSFGEGAYHPVSDRYVVARYCELQELRATYLKQLSEEGWLTVGSKGQQAVHPLARLLQNLDRSLQGLEDRLGLNPESRIRLSIGRIEAKSKLDAFLDDDA
jgi:P27 family predicted phage terminase small subunit